MLKILKLSKDYSETHALDEIDFELVPGDFCALVGANGAGKSTLLRLMANLEYKTAGSVSIGELDVCEDHTSLKEQMAYINEDIHFHYPGTISDFLQAYKSFYKNWDETFLTYLFDHQFLNKDLNYYELSRGQKMQLLIAACLARKPKYILVDEVTAVMDHLARKTIVEYLKNYCDQNQAIIVFATNIISELNYSANKLLMLNKGKVLLFDEFNTLKKNLIKFRAKQDLMANNQSTIWISHNADGHSSYICSLDEFNSIDRNATLSDKREILMDELYQYYYAKMTQVKLC